jgi:hypothetical protein
VSTIHETLTDARVLHKLAVVHAVVEQHERTAVCFPLTHQGLLTSQDPLYCILVVVAVDEQVWNKLFIVVVSIFRGGHDDTGWEMLLVVQDISDEDGLAGVPLAYKNTNLVIGHGLWIKLSELQLCHSLELTQVLLQSGERA